MGMVWPCLFLGYPQDLFLACSSLRTTALEDELSCGLRGIHDQREITALRLRLEGSVNIESRTQT